MDPKKTKFLLGQPARYPSDLVAALRPVFERHDCIKRAYVGQFFDPTQHKQPHLVIGLEATAGWEAAANDAAMAAKRAYLGLPVDFLRIAGSGPIETYLVESTQPFFER